MGRWFPALIALAALLPLAACTGGLAGRPAQLGMTDEEGPTIEVVENLTLPVGPGERRTIERGSVWIRVGRVGAGDVYKPVERVFTIEGRRAREAYLVLDAGHRVVGFYLPVERAYAPAPNGPSAALSLRRIR
jgi:hypothetical protein